MLKQIYYKLDVDKLKAEIDVLLVRKDKFKADLDIIENGVYAFFTSLNQEDNIFEKDGGEAVLFRNGGLSSDWRIGEGW